MVIVPRRQKAPPTKKNADVLFVCAPTSGHKGLGNNAWHSVNVLTEYGVPADWCQIPETDIQAAIEQVKPRAVVIMALWVNSATLSRLSELFPQTNFVVKNHSGPQFLAQEGRGWQLLFETADLGQTRDNVFVAAVKTELADAMSAMGMKAIELPNVYTKAEIFAKVAARKLSESDGCLHVGLWGAFRPLKNAVGMAAAVSLATSLVDRPIVLHINGTRQEMGAIRDSEILRQFCMRSGIELRIHGWLEHAAFKRLAASMDVSICHSFDETYCYVAADCISAGCPVAGSPAVFWLPGDAQCNPDSTESMARSIASYASLDNAAQRKALWTYNEESIRRNIASLACLGVESARAVVDAFEPSHLPTTGGTPARTCYG